MLGSAMWGIVVLVFKWSTKLVGVGKKRRLFHALRTICARVGASILGSVAAIHVAVR